VDNMSLRVVSESSGLYAEKARFKC